MSFAISVENVSKSYQLGTIGGASLVDDLTRWWARMRGQPDPLAKIGQHHARHIGTTFFALDDVSFGVTQGEIVGIIGGNGAGKSTLLKILSQVTSPTSGQIQVRGRIASLLEVGTGFHPELTGRENIFLNGAILGMSKSEIRKKFDEIVDFSECEEFIETPVKRYSSGMYVRLAFAVAAHLEPEILIVDEVLAVGDAQFQKKCLGKMQAVGQEGRTVLFVSHTMSAITRLCSRAVLLGGGHVLRDGPAPEVVADYLNPEMGSVSVREWKDLTEAPGDEVVRLVAVRVRDESGLVSVGVDIRKPLGIEVEYQVTKPGSVLIPNIHILNGEGAHVFSSLNWDPEWRHQPRPVGRYRSVCWIPGNFMGEGSFVVTAALTTYSPYTIHAKANEALTFQVIDSAEGETARGDYAGQMQGSVRPLLPWITSVERGA